MSKKHSSDPIGMQPKDREMYIAIQYLDPDRTRRTSLASDRSFMIAVIVAILLLAGFAYMMLSR
jgi:hypothetical protein